MTPEHPHARVARSLWEAIAEGDASLVEGLLADDVVWRAMGRNPLSGEYRGASGVLDYLARVGETADELNSTLQRILIDDEGAALLHHVSAVRGSDPLEMDMIIIFKMSEGKIVSATSIPVDQADNDRFWNTSGR
jgi:ketosteroid isomerase-like protein